MFGYFLAYFFYALFFLFPFIPYKHIILPSTSNIYYKSYSKDVPYCCLIILMLGLSVLYIFALFFASHQHLLQKHSDTVTKVLDYSNWNRIILFDKIAFGTSDNVADPHGQTIAVYRLTAKLIEEGCKRILADLRNKRHDKLS